MFVCQRADPDPTSSTSISSRCVSPSEAEVSAMNDLGLNGEGSEARKGHTLEGVDQNEGADHSRHIIAGNFICNLPAVPVKMRLVSWSRKHQEGALVHGQTRCKSSELTSKMWN